MVHYHHLPYYHPDHLHHCTMGKLRNEPKSRQLLQYFSRWMLILKVPNFKQRYLNSPKKWKFVKIFGKMGKVGGKDKVNGCKNMNRNIF